MRGLHTISMLNMSQRQTLPPFLLQAVGEGHTSLRYLARYVFRVAISNNRIKNISDNAITFSYKDRQKKTWKTMELKPMECIRRFLQHVLPEGFIHPVTFPIGKPI
jgi:hypothetical protein